LRVFPYLAEPPLFNKMPRETVWKIRIGPDLGRSEWPKQGGDVTFEIQVTEED
jgi:hypothetical protein